VFVSSGALDALRDLTKSLATGDVAGINAANTALNTAFDNVQGIVGDVGARGNQLSMTSAALDNYEGTVTEMQSNLQDVDTATAITDLTARQNAYQAALLAVSKTLGLSLTDYLK
jgi:flagellar hook-associated protein 3 FlgL